MTSPEGYEHKYLLPKITLAGDSDPCTSYYDSDQFSSCEALCCPPSCSNVKCDKQEEIFINILCATASMLKLDCALLSCCVPFRWVLLDDKAVLSSVAVILLPESTDLGNRVMKSILKCVDIYNLRLHIDIYRKKQCVSF